MQRPEWIRYYCTPIIVALLHRRPTFDPHGRPIDCLRSNCFVHSTCIAGLASLLLRIWRPVIRRTERTFDDANIRLYTILQRWRGHLFILTSPKSKALLTDRTLTEMIMGIFAQSQSLNEKALLLLFFFVLAPVWCIYAVGNVCRSWRWNWILIAPHK